MTDKKRNSKLLPSLLFYFILLLIIAGILGIVVLTNINIAENWFGLDEYTVVETRDQVIGYLPLLWYFLVSEKEKGLCSIGSAHWSFSLASC